MIGRESQEVERKVVAILRILHQSPGPLGGKVIARRLSAYGIGLGERTVRYHLKLMDERGLTRPVGNRDGRSITPEGVEELRDALVNDRVGSVAGRIESLSVNTSFSVEALAGEVPANASFMSKADLPRALERMAEVVEAGLCLSDRVALVGEGDLLGEVRVPQGMVGLATLSCVVVSGALLKLGIPIDPKFGGLLQIQRRRPFRFTELIEYAGCTVDPAEMFIASRMTRVRQAARVGEGTVVASFWEIPAASWAAAGRVIASLKAAELGASIILGDIGQPVCSTAVPPNRSGMVLFSGLNLAAAAVEAQLEVTNHAMSGLIDFNRLVPFRTLQQEYPQGRSPSPSA